MRRATRSIATALTVLLAAAAAAPAQTEAPPSGDERQAAMAALPTLARLATGDKARRLGFHSPEEAARAALGEPFRIRVVRLDQLRAYDPSQDPAPLLADAPRVLFPVLAGSAVRLGIEVRHAQGGWKVARIGGAGNTVLLDAARAAQRASAPAGTVYSAVQVPALNLYLLEADAAGSRQLIPLTDDPRFPRLKAGVALPAAEALAALVPAAQALDPKGST